MDASVVDENDAVASDPDLDLFNDENGPPYSAEFIERYRSAQIARNNAITDWAETELKRVHAAGFSDRPFTVLRTWADPRMVDPTLEPTKRPANMCYAGVPVKANRSAHGIAAACTLRNWMGMWSLRHAQTRAEPHLARINCPALVINAEQDTGVYPSDAQRIYDALASTDKRSARSTPTTTSPPRARAARRPIRSPSGSRSGGAEESSPTSFPATRFWNSLRQRSDWLDIRYCAEDDDDTFYRELPDAEVIWHVLRPISGADLEQAPHVRLVHKLGAGVNTIDVDTATRLGIAVANMPGANAPSVAEGTVLLMLAALRRLPAAGPGHPRGHGLAVRPEPRRDGARHRRLHRRTGRLRQHREDAWRRS